MTTFQKINRKRWPTWARMTLLALAAAMVVVLVLPQVVSSGPADSPPTGIHGVEPNTIGHVGGDAVEDCAFVDAEGLTEAYGYTSNPARDAGTSGEPDTGIPVTDIDGVPIAGVKIVIITPSPDGDHSQTFDYEVYNGGVKTFEDTLLEAPQGKNLSHVSFCLRAGVNGDFEPLYIEVKGARDTNDYDYTISFDCNDTNPVQVAEGYQVTLNCLTAGKTITALFSAGVNTVLLETFSASSEEVWFVEYLEFPAQAPTTGDTEPPFDLKHDDVGPTYGDVLVPTPRCLFNPDPPAGAGATGPGDGIINVATDSLAMPNDHTTCFFLAHFEQQPGPLNEWIAFYGLLNVGDGLRGIY